MSLKVFLQQSTLPDFKCVDTVTETRQRIVMTESTQRIRKYCVGAILRNITISKKTYESFIDLQVSCFMLLIISIKFVIK